MKILGITQDGELYLKGDSAILVNDKPFFLPINVGGLTATECVVARISRLGKNIAPRFAGRYYEQVTMGFDIQAPEQTNWTARTSIEGSLPIGEFADKNEDWITPYIALLDDAVSKVSQLMTLRMGDFVCVDLSTQHTMQKDANIEIIKNEIRIVRCRVK